MSQTDRIILMQPVRLYTYILHIDHMLLPISVLYVPTLYTFARYGPVFWVLLRTTHQKFAKVSGARKLNWSRANLCSENVCRLGLC